MSKKQKWDVNNTSELIFDEGVAPCFKLWPTKGANTALLDADMFPYMVGFTQSEADWSKVLLRASDNGKSPSTKGFNEWLFLQPECQSAINHCDALVNAWAEMIDADSAKLFLTSGEGQFRYDIAFTKLYKGNRDKPKPPFFFLLKWHLEHNHKSIVCYKNEADDAMSIVQYQHNKKLCKKSGYKQGSRKLKGFSYVTIVTKDKDLSMIPGWHSNPDVNKGEPYWVTELGDLQPVYHPETNRMKKLGGSGLMFFYAQILMGDVVDNYGGLPGCGMVATYRVLKDLETVEDLHRVVSVMYKNKFNPYDMKAFPYKSWTGKEIHVTWVDLFLEQGRLAWMQRSEGDVWEKKFKSIKPKKWRLYDKDGGFTNKV